MTMWNEIASSCSGGKVFMTAQLVEINKHTGQVKMINACHEWPSLFRFRGTSVEWDEGLEFDKNITLGETHSGVWNKTEFVLGPGDYLLLYSDGLFGVENDKKETLNDRRLAKSIARKLSKTDPQESEQFGSVRLINVAKEVLNQHGSLTQ